MIRWQWIGLVGQCRNDAGRRQFGKAGFIRHGEKSGVLDLADRMRRRRPLGKRSAVTAAIGVGRPALVGARIDTHQHAVRFRVRWRAA